MELSKSNYISITQRDDRRRDLSFKKFLKRLKELSNHDYFFERHSIFKSFCDIHNFLQF